MKALSVKRPWADWIVSGRKSVENRSWRTHYRGSVAVHASGAGLVQLRRGDDEAVHDLFRPAEADPQRPGPRGDRPRGAALVPRAAGEFPGAAARPPNAGLTTDKLAAEYRALLARLDPEKGATSLGDGVVMLCWEAPALQCHRRLVAAWLEGTLGIEVPEAGFRGG